MNRGELEELIAQYMHRDDLEANIPGFIELATARIGRDLRSAENQTTAQPLGPELVQNGDFTDGTTNWAGNGITQISVASNQMTVVRNSSGYQNQCVQTARTPKSGVAYQVTVDVDSASPSGALGSIVVFGAPRIILPFGVSSTIITATTDPTLSLNTFNDVTGTSIYNSVSVKEVGFSATQQVSELPNNFRSIKDISYTASSRRVVLKSSSPATMGAYPQTGNAPAFYRIFGRQIEITPFQAKEFRMIYFNSPEPLLETPSENAILTAYPQIYLYASLIEGYFFTQDAGGHGLAVETYTSEVAAENKRTESADMGDRPSIQGGN